MDQAEDIPPLKLSEKRTLAWAVAAKANRIADRRTAILVNM